MGDDGDLRSRIEAQVLARRLGTASARHDRAEYGAAHAADAGGTVASDHAAAPAPLVVELPEAPGIALIPDGSEPSRGAGTDVQPHAAPTPTVNGQRDATAYVATNGRLNGVNGVAAPPAVLGATGAGIHATVAEESEPAAAARRLAEAQARLAAAESLLAEARRGQEQLNPFRLAEADRADQLARDNQIARLIAALQSAEAARHAEAARRIQAEARAAALEQRLAVAEQIDARLEGTRVEAERAAEIGLGNYPASGQSPSNDHLESSNGYLKPFDPRYAGQSGDGKSAIGDVTQPSFESTDGVDALRHAEPAAPRRAPSHGVARSRAGASPVRVLGTPSRLARHKVAARLGAVAVVAVIAAVLLRSFVVASYYIPSASMEPTLHGCSGCNNDHILVNKLAYTLHSVRRGDVIVFDRPAEADSVTDEKVLIKRVVGLPGDVLTDRDGTVYLNGQALDEPYVNPACNGTQSFPATPVTVPKGDVYVMGDNRCDSLDSRTFGAVPQSLIIGRAFIIIWPLGRVHYL